MDNKVKLITKDGTERVKLFKAVLGTKQGQILLAYLESVYKGKTDLESPNNMYYRLGQRDVVRDMITLTNKKQKED